MKYQGVVGIGCYGKPETISRVLKKMVGKYIVGNFKAPDRKDNQQCVQFETLKLLKALIGGLLENHQLSETEVVENIKNFGITGFFLALERRRLNLSLFTRHGQPMNSLSLDGQTKISPAGKARG
jgi:hypothetical protein